MEGTNRRSVLFGLAPTSRSAKAGWLLTRHPIFEPSGRAIHRRQWLFQKYQAHLTFHTMHKSLNKMCFVLKFQSQIRTPMHPDVLPQGTTDICRPCLHLAPTGRRCLGKRGTNSRQLGQGILLGGRSRQIKLQQLRPCVWELISLQPSNVRRVCPLMKKRCAYNRVMFSHENSQV